MYVTQPGATVIVTAPADQPPATGAPVLLPRQGAIVGIGGFCADDNGAMAVDGSRIKLWTCNGTKAQVWTLPTDGTVRVVGFCLRIANNATVPGVRVEIWTCNGDASQQWSVVDDHIVNTRTGLCLASPGDLAVEGTELTVESCGPAPGQRWALPPLL